MLAYSLGLPRACLVRPGFMVLFWSLAKHRKEGVPRHNDSPAAWPFLSSEIRKGEQWPTTLKEELKTTQFAIVCVTSENQGEPWLNFEAGAASNQLDNILVC